MNCHVTRQQSQRLEEILQEVGAVSPVELTPLSPPRHIPTFRIPDDDRKADAVLGQLRIELSQDHSRPKVLQRRFSIVKTSTKCSYEEIYAALTRVIEEKGLPGVAEVLLGRFKGLGGDTNVSRRASTGLIQKFRNNSSLEQRGHLLELAVESGRVDFVQLLAPDADQSSLNESLSTALQRRDLALLEVLLQYGANVANYQDAFWNAIDTGDVELVELMLRAPNSVPERCATSALIPAVTNGLLPLVFLLLHAGANCNHDGGAALMRAVEACRIDLIAALVSSKKPPAHNLLDEALRAAISTPTTEWNSIYSLTEVLLCAGPVGDAINEGLFKATVLSNAQMMQLFLKHRADINYNGACAVSNAIHRNRTDLVGLLLQQQDLRPEAASELVGRIPQSASSTERIASLSKLLVYGASGVHCDEQLIIAASQNDLETARLLITYGREQSLPQVVSVDYNGARSLQTAVSQGNIEMVKILALDGHPSDFYLSKAILSIPKLGVSENFAMIQTLLRAGARGPEVDDALRIAIAAPEKPKRLIDLLIKYSSRVDENTLFLSVSQGNADIVQALLARDVCTTACSPALSLAMKLPMSQHRFRIAKLLLDHRVAGDAGHEVAQGVVHLVQNCPGDIKLLRLLCHEGKASINFDRGLAVVLATRYSDPIILDILLRSEGEPANIVTITNALQCAMDLPRSDLHRKHKVETILRGVKPKEAMDDALVQEIESYISVKGDNSVIEILLSNGADINAHEAASVCHAIRDPAILDLVLARRPTQQSLALAFPLAMALGGPERIIVCEKLLRAGAVGEELSKALCGAVKEGRGAFPLMKILLSHADINYRNGRPLRLAARQAFRDGLELLLAPRTVEPSVPTKISVLTEAMKLKGKQDRHDIMKILLKVKIPTLALSDALIIATDNSDQELVELLLSHGASVDHKDGQAIRSASSSGQTEVLKALVNGKLSSKPLLSTLTSGFGGAMLLKGNDSNAYHAAVEVLLSAGMRGEAVNAALLESVREGDSNVKMTKMIYNNGASAEWQEGKALDIATQMACVETMEVLLGKKLSQSTLSRAYSSALTLPRDERYQAVKILLEAGKEIDKPVITTLIHAVRDSALNLEFIQLLLRYNVFDDGASMIFAAKVFDIDALTLLVESPKAAHYTSRAFRAAMSTPEFWTSEKSMAIVELLLGHGASGELVADALIETVERYQGKEDAFTNTLLDVLLRSAADVNHKQGLALQYAAQQVNLSLIQKLLPNSTSDSKAMAIPYLFKSSSDKSTILNILQAFSEYSVDEYSALDISFKHPDPELEPVLPMAMSSFPRRTQILRALLDIGYSPNQWGMYEIETGIGSEPWPVLCWALSQPEKKISSANIELLIDEGADVNFKSKSGITPLMLSIENQRPDILAKLISKGAKVTISDENGLTPLAFASQIGNTKMMEHLLAAGAEIDDGSLHDAAGDLRCDAMRVLVKYGYDVDYPSERHDGRSALAELCLNAVDKGPKQDLEDAVRFLLANDADFRIHGVLEKSVGKSIFHYALDSLDPTTMLQVLLKLPLWKLINEECFLYKDETYTYSLTKYVEKDLFSGPRSQKDEILRLLRTKRATDRFWATSLDATQPEDICGAPPYIREEFLRQKARQKRLLEQREDAMAMVSLKRDTVMEEEKIMIIQTNQEIKRTMEKSRAEVHLMEIKADTELKLFTRAENERQRLLRNTQKSEVSHLQALGTIQASNARAIRHAEIEEDATRNLMQLEYDGKRINCENEGLRTRFAIENSAREVQEKASMRLHERELVRMRLQSSVMDKSSALAGQLQASGMNQRQIGYVVGEV